MKAYELTPEESARAKRRLSDRSKSPPSVTELTRAVFGEEESPRSFRVRAIRRLLAKKDWKLTLTAAQRRTVESHASTMDSKELARLAFADDSLEADDPRVVAVAVHLQSLPREKVFADPREYTPSKYRPPATIKECVARVRRYTGENLDSGNLSVKQRKDAEALMRHMRVLRFLREAQNYQREADRDLFESTFVRYVWPKAADIANEECDVFIILAAESVLEANVKKRIDSLQGMLDDTVKEARDDDKRKISMSLVEAIGKLQTEYDSCVKRQKTLLNEVNVKRSERIKGKIAENQSLLTIMEFWRGEEGRRHLVKLAEAWREKVGKSAEDLAGLSEIDVQIFGVSPEDLGIKHA